MARIRSIKPDFFKDEDLCQLPREHRLLYVGLWTQSDRTGRLEYRPKNLKIELFPWDNDITVEVVIGMLQQLSDPKLSDRPNKKFIEIYTVEGVSYIQIFTLGKHQKFHHDERPKNFPASRGPAGGQQGADNNNMKTLDFGPAGGQQEANPPVSGILVSGNTVNGTGSFSPEFDSDRINSDTPLPPILQHEWDLLLQIYPKPQGIVKGRDRAVRLFVKSPERARILKNAGHYSCSDDVLSGFVQGLDKFVSGGFRDYDDLPLGHSPPDTIDAREALLAALKDPRNHCMPHLTEAAEALFREKGMAWSQLQEKIKKGERIF